MGAWNIPAGLDSWEQVSAQIESELRENFCPRETVTSIIVAADEIFANISAYAYGGGNGTVEVESRTVPLEHGRYEYSLTFCDSGIRFNPLDAPKYEKGSLARQKYNSGSPGGFGIHIIRKKADRLSYEYEDGKNVLCFIKFYDSEL